jgi:DNA mismatch repair ATPase MutS
MTAILLFVVSAQGLHPGVLTAWLVAQSTLALAWRRRVARVIQGVDAAAYDLGLLAELLACIEQQPFASARLRALRRVLIVAGVMPSRRILHLQRLIAVRDVNRNLLMKPFALLFLVRSQAAVAIDRWHARHRSDLARWLEVVGELEALSSFGTYAFEHPDDQFPTIGDGNPVFSARALSHPLIPESSGVRNDVSLGGGAPHVLIVSGSNMSGKSTLLRAIGANAVLGMAGAPVRAHALTMTPVRIGATIHVEDSLREGHSRFYAEILRIRDVVALARGGEPALFLFDEILGGTNSHDRRIGAAAIVRALVNTGAIGAITTHDLALTQLVEESGSLARNVHFDDRLEEGKIRFDYRMHEGVVEHSNALELMRSVGLEV